MRRSQRDRQMRVISTVLYWIGIAVVLFVAYKVLMVITGWS